MGAGRAGCWLRRQQGLGLLWLGFGSRSVGRGQLLVGHRVCGLCLFQKMSSKMECVQSVGSEPAPPRQPLSTPVT